MAPYAYGFHGKSQHFSNFNGTCLGKYDIEKNCSSLGRLFHLCHKPWRTSRMNRNRNLTVSRSKSQKNSIEKRLLQNKGPLFGKNPQLQWSRSRSQKTRCGEKILHPFRSKQGRVVFGPLLIPLPLF